MKLKYLIQLTFRITPLYWTFIFDNTKFPDISRTFPFSYLTLMLQLENCFQKSYICSWENEKCHSAYIFIDLSTIIGTQIVIYTLKELQKQLCIRHFQEDSQRLPSQFPLTFWAHKLIDIHKLEIKNFPETSKTFSSLDIQLWTCTYCEAVLFFSANI